MGKGLGLTVADPSLETLLAYHRPQNLYISNSQNSLLSKDYTELTFQEAFSGVFSVVFSCKIWGVFRYVLSPLSHNRPLCPLPCKRKGKARLWELFLSPEFQPDKVRIVSRNVFFRRPSCILCRASFPPTFVQSVQVL